MREVFIVTYEDPWDHFTVIEGVFSTLEKAQAAFPGEWSPIGHGYPEWQIRITAPDGSGRMFTKNHLCVQQPVDPEGA